MSQPPARSQKQVDRPVHRALTVGADRVSGAGREASQGTIGRDSLRVLISQSTGNAGWFAAVLVLARALGPTHRGTVAFITVTALVAAMFANFGVNDATRIRSARSPALRPALLANVTLVALAGGATAGLCVAGVLGLIPTIRPAGVGGPELVILALATTATAGELAAVAFLQGCGRFRAFSRVQATGPWLYAVALAVVQITAGLTVLSAVAIWTAERFLVVLVMLSVGAAETGFSRPDFRVLRESVQFGARAWIGSTSRVLNARTDQVITGMISTAATLGIYSVAVNASEILFYLPVAAAMALIPAVAGGDANTRLERVLRVYRAVLLITLVGCAVAIAVGPLLLPVVFGHAYLPSVGPFLIMVPSAIGYATMAVFSGASLGSLAPGRSSLGPIAALVTQTTLDFVLIPPLGASGAAIAATSALLVGGAVAVFSYRTNFPFSWQLLMPRPSDVTTISRLARTILRRVTPTHAEAVPPGPSGGEVARSSRPGRLRYSSPVRHRDVADGLRVELGESTVGEFGQPPPADELGRAFAPAYEHDEPPAAGVVSVQPISTAAEAMSIRTDQEVSTATDSVEFEYRRADQLGEAAGAFNLAVLLHRRGDLPRALAAYQRAEQKGDPDAAFNVGVLLYETGDIDGAEAAWRRSLERRHAKAATNLGFLLQARGDLEGARAAYSAAARWGDEAGARMAAALPIPGPADSNTA